MSVKSEVKAGLENGWSEARDYPLRADFWPVNDACQNLRKVADDECLVSVLIKALKDKGVRRLELHVVNDHAAKDDEDVAVLRGDVDDVLNRLFERGKG